MILIKTSSEIESLRKSGKILSSVLKNITNKVKSGVTTWDIELKIRELISQYNAEPAFLGYKKYPAAACISVNEELVHGIPSKNKVLKNGDLVSVDIGIKYEGLITDASVTIGVGVISEVDRKLIDVTKEALEKSIKVIKAGKSVNDISAMIQSTVENNGFAVIRDCTGHGVGRKVHEDPTIPNFVVRGHSPILEEGMTIAIEPIASRGGFKTKVKPNNWTIATKDNSRTAHFEQTIVVTKGGAEILTPF